MGEGAIRWSSGLSPSCIGFESCHCQDFSFSFSIESPRRFLRIEAKIISQFCRIEKDCSWNVYRLSKNDEKLPYLHKITKKKFLVCNKNMGLCLYIRSCKLNFCSNLIFRTRPVVHRRVRVPEKRSDSKRSRTARTHKTKPSRLASIHLDPKVMQNDLTHLQKETRNRSRQVENDPTNFKMKMV